MLRVLQEQTFEPVGGAESVRVDVRVIAATNKNLLEETGAGHFRQDLYYRLNVIPITVPPLRERSQDIPLLCDHFLALFSKQYGRPPKALAADAKKVLQRYDWPGNVRELRNLMEWIVIMVTGQEVRSADLSLPGGLVAAKNEDLFRPNPLKEARDAFEREFIRQALARHNGNVSKTAEELQIERRHLYRRLASLGLQKENDHGHD